MHTRQVSSHLFFSLTKNKWLEDGSQETRNPISHNQHGIHNLYPNNCCPWRLTPSENRGEEKNLSDNRFESLPCQGEKGGMLYYFKHMISKQIINNFKVHQRSEAQWHKTFNGNHSCLCNSALPSKTVYSTGLACTRCAERALELSRACQSHALLWHFKGSSTVWCKLSLQMWKRFTKCIIGSFKSMAWYSKHRSWFASNRKST